MSKGIVKGSANVLLWTIVGAIVGYSSAKGFKLMKTFQETLNFNLIWILVPVLFIIALILYFNSVKQFNDMNCETGLSEDDQFIYQVSKHNKASSNIVNAYHVLFLSFCLSITILINPETKYLIFFIVYFLLCAVFLVYIRRHNNKVLGAYPTLTNSEVSINFSDMQLMENVIDAIDEGERLVMLHSLSKTYQIIILMLSLILILLGGYQAVTGENQYLSMFSISAVLVYSTYVYYKKNEEFNR